MSESTEQIYFINQLYHDFILPDILGEDSPDILYWAGKHVARKYELSNLDDLTQFFDMAGFGHLEQVKESRRQVIFRLSGQNVVDRLASQNNDFALESGIVAEAVQLDKDREAEAVFTPAKHQQGVQITVQFD
ncbi:MAG: YslB family protein [Lactobacillus sp.]|jgi:predicted hydrocarbon binding protein|nr:YslB family protein [Lactobacillus sp.]